MPLVLEKGKRTQQGELLFTRNPQSTSAKRFACSISTSRAFSASFFRVHDLLLFQ